MWQYDACAALSLAGQASAPAYFTDNIKLVADSDRHQLWQDIPRSMYSIRATTSMTEVSWSQAHTHTRVVWNSLPSHLRQTWTVNDSSANWKRFCSQTSQSLALTVNQVSTSLGNSGLCWNVFARNRDTAVPAEENGDLQTLMRVLVERCRRCLMLSILSPDKTEWLLISATFCGWRRCFVADQLWLMTRIREEEDWLSV